jgi:hypothetical protein
MLSTPVAMTHSFGLQSFIDLGKSFKILAF